MSKVLLVLTLAGGLVTACAAGDDRPAAGPTAPATTASGAAQPGAGGATPGASTPGPTSVARGEEDWVDPEPPDAQRRAEAVAAADWNRDKTTRLTMHLTTLVDRRSGIGRAASRLAAREASLEDRLGRLGAEVTDTEIVIRLPGAILFDFDKSDIRPDAERALVEVAAVLSAYADRPVRVEGHTDSIASESYNLALSQRRAESVRDWLVAHGIAAARLRTAGLGEAHPIADNGTAEGRRQNRRVEIVVEKKG